MKKFITLSILLLSSTLAFADSIELELKEVNGDGIDFEGFNISGDFYLNNDVFLIANYQRLDSTEEFEFNTGNYRLEEASYNVGAGIDINLSESVYVSSSASYKHTKLEIQDISFKADGYSVKSGVFFVPVDALTVGLSYKYEELSNSEGYSVTPSGFTLSAEYDVNSEFSTTLSYGEDDQSETISLGFAVNF